MEKAPHREEDAGGGRSLLACLYVPLPIGPAPPANSLYVQGSYRQASSGAEDLDHYGVRPLGDVFASGLIAALGGPLTVALCAGGVGLYSCFLLPRPALHSF